MNPTSNRPGLKPILIYTAIFFAVWSLRATILYSIDRGIQSGVAKWFYSETAKILIWTVPVFIYLKATGRQEPLAFLKLTTPVPRRALWLAVAVIIGYLGGMLIFAHLVEGKNLSALFHTSGSEILLRLLQTSVSPFSEELLYRGFILTTLSERLRFWQANVITTLLFVLIHWPYYLWAQGFTPWLVTFSIGIFIIGLILGWLVKLTNSLWPSVGMHIANNFLVSFLRS